MRLEQQYEEVLRLKREINRKLKEGTDFQNIKELILLLTGDSAYPGLKQKDNQLLMLDNFFGIWLEEKKKLPQIGIKADIFNKISSLDELERKYRRIKYLGFRTENAVPEHYREQTLKWLKEDNVSGLAIGRIVFFETLKREENLLTIAQYLKQRGDSINALLLLEYGNEALPGRERLLAEEADIWISAGEYKKALELLGQIKNPTQDMKKLIEELEGLGQVVRNE